MVKRLSVAMKTRRDEYSHTLYSFNTLPFLEVLHVIYQLFGSVNGDTTLKHLQPGALS